MKILKKTLLIITSLLMVTIILLFSVWYNLPVLVNAKNLKVLNEKYFPQVRIVWSTVNIEINNKGWVNKDLFLSVTDSCIKYKSSDICFKALEMSVSIYPLDIFDSKINSLMIGSKKSKLYLDEIIAPSEEKKYFSIVESLKQGLSVKNSLYERWPSQVTIDIDGFQFTSGENTSTIKVQLEGKELQGMLSQSKSQVTWSVISGESNKYSGSVNYKNEEVLAKVQFQVLLDEIINGKFDIDVDKKVTAKLKKNIVDPKIFVKLDLNISDDNLTIDLKESKLGFKRYIDKISVGECSLELPLSKSVIGSKWATWECPDIKIISNFNKKLKNSWIFDASTEGRLKEKIEFYDKRNLWGHAKVHVLNKKPNFMNLTIDSNIEFGFQETFFVQIKKLFFEVNAPKYESVVKHLEGSSLAIPAPFNELKGEVKITSSTESPLGEIKKSLPFDGRISLKSSQKFVIDTEINGQYHFVAKKNSPQVEANVLINSLYLYLPPFDPLKKVPRWKSDDRIVETIKVEKKKKKKTANQFRYSFNVKSKKTDSVRVYYHLFDPFLSVNTDLRVGNKSIVIKLNKGENFNINYLKRQVTVQKLKLSNAASSGQLPMETRLLYETSGYNVYIDIFGTLEKPRVVLSSYPSLARKDIISLLIFNRLSKDVTSFESESVGSAEAAIADRAIGLLGIWAFASTPIEAISYNPQTKVYGAQVALPGGVKLNIGTDWERVQSLSFRKRISSTWALVTSYDTGDGDKNLGTVFLQKEVSY